MMAQQDLGPISKKRTKVIAIALIVVVAVSVALVFVLLPKHEENHNHGFSTGFAYIQGGYRISIIGNLTPPVYWGNLSAIQLSDGTDTISWLNLTTADLTSSGGSITWNYGSAKQLGSLWVWLNITDKDGDGCIGNGDYFDWTTGGSPFSSTGFYTMTCLLRSTGGSLLSVGFNTPQVFGPP